MLYAWVKDALSHYWGGPKLTDSPLAGLRTVRRRWRFTTATPRRVRAVLQEAIERQRPVGERKLTASEWLLYNILDLRFIQGLRVRDIALRLAMSESDLYRKQPTGSRRGRQDHRRDGSGGQHVRSRTLRPRRTESGQLTGIMTPRASATGGVQDWVEGEE